MTLPEKTPEEIRRLKARGVFDVGTSYMIVGGASRRPKHKFWDGYKPPDE